MTSLELVAMVVVATGVVAGWAVSARSRELLRERLPAPGHPARDRGRSRGGGPESLAARAAARGWPLGPGSYAAALVGAGLLGAAAGFRVAGPVGGAAGLLAGPTVVEGWLGRRLAAARMELEEDLRDWIRALAAASRAGLSLRRALREAAGDAGPSLRRPLDEVTAYLEAGGSIEESVGGLARRIGSRDAELLAAVLSVHRRTGGDLPSLLDDVAETVARRLAVRRDLRALTAQGRASGAVLALLPVAFVGLLSGMGGNGLGDFYRTASGSALLALGLGLQGVGFLWIRRIVGGPR